MQLYFTNLRKFELKTRMYSMTRSQVQAVHAMPKFFASMCQKAYSLIFFVFLKNLPSKPELASFVVTQMYSAIDIALPRQ